MPPCITPALVAWYEYDFLCRSGSVGSVRQSGRLPVYKLLGGAVRDEIQFYATVRVRIWQKRWALSVAKCRRMGAT